MKTFTRTWKQILRIIFYYCRFDKRILTFVVRNYKEWASFSHCKQRQHYTKIFPTTPQEKS